MKITWAGLDPEIQKIVDIIKERGKPFLKPKEDMAVRPPVTDPLFTSVRGWSVGLLSVYAYIEDTTKSDPLELFTAEYLEHLFEALRDVVVFQFRGLPIYYLRFSESIHRRDKDPQFYRNLIKPCLGKESCQ